MCIDNEILRNLEFDCRLARTENVWVVCGLGQQAVVSRGTISRKIMVEPDLILALISCARELESLHSRLMEEEKLEHKQKNEQGKVPERFQTL